MCRRHYFERWLPDASISVQNAWSCSAKGWGTRSKWAGVERKGHGLSLAGGSWTAVPVPYTSGTVGDIVFNVTGTGPLNVTATIPASKSAGGKLFGRVKGVTP